MSIEYFCECKHEPHIECFRIDETFIYTCETWIIHFFSFLFHSYWVCKLAAAHLLLSFSANIFVGPKILIFFKFWTSFSIALFFSLVIYFLIQYYNVVSPEISWTNIPTNRTSSRFLGRTNRRVYLFSTSRIGI